jgi:hypothetical protein
MGANEFATRGSVPIPVGGHKENQTKRNNKVRITIHLDREIISYFKHKSAQTAKRYQTLINEALREYTGLANQPTMIVDLVERVKRLEEELLRRPSD